MADDPRDREDGSTAGERVRPGGMRYLWAAWIVVAGCALYNGRFEYPRYRQTIAIAYAALAGAAVVTAVLYERLAVFSYLRKHHYDTYADLTLNTAITRRTGGSGNFFRTAAFLSSAEDLGDPGFARLRAKLKALRRFRWTVLASLPLLPWLIVR